MLRDRYNRKIDYLRISITDRCNLRCSYCMPEDGIRPKPHEEILRYEEIQRFAEAAVEAGISKIRLTGGEPLMRKDAVKLVEMLTKIPGLKDLSLTTNGLLVSEHGDDLKRAGLNRINISIDSLDPKVYRDLTRCGDVGRALEGLMKALELGLNPVKINVVLLKGINDNPEDFIKLIFDYPVHVRFIELMPISKWDPSLYLSVDDLKVKLKKYGPFGTVVGPIGAGPADYVTFKGALGTIGFISPISNHFCGSCNRLRLTPDGMLRTCLFSDIEFDVGASLRNNIGKSEIISVILDTLNDKPARHDVGGKDRVERLMYQIGG